MKKTLIEIFKPNPKSLTLNDIKNALGYKTITNVQKRHRLDIKQSQTFKSVTLSKIYLN